MTRIVYQGGCYHLVHRVGYTQGGQVYVALNVPNSHQELVEDYPYKSHRILKIVRDCTEANEDQYDNLDALIGLAEEQELSHPYIIRIDRHFISLPDYIISFEDLDGCIQSLIRSGSIYGHGMPESLTCFILRKILEVLIFLHSKEYSHEELDGWSLFYNIGRQPAIKISLWASSFQYGLLSKSHRRLTGADRITRKVQCPEVRDGEVYTTKSDIWSLGICAMELGLGAFNVHTNAYVDHLINCFRSKNQEANEITKGMENVFSKSIRFPTMQIRGKIRRSNMLEIPSIRNKKYPPIYFSSNLVDLIVKCTMVDPIMRPTADELTRHPFFQNYDIDESAFQKTIHRATMLCKEDDNNMQQL